MSRAFMIKQAPFKPTDIGGCQLWLDGADATSTGITLSGTSVSSWNDKSGNAYNLTQGTAGSQPSYSANLITFSSNKFLNIPQAVMNNAATWSLFFVINPISSSNWIMVKQKNGQNTYNVLSMTINTNSGGGGQTGSTGFLYWRSFNAGSQAVSTAALTTSTLQICNLTYDGTNLYFYKNGVLEKTTTGTFAIQNDTNATNYTMGIWIQDGTIPNSGVTNFQFGELNFYSSFLNLTQRQQVESYLAQKWGLRQQLPQGHPGTRGLIYPIQRLPNASALPYQVIFSPLQIQPGSCQLWLDAYDSLSVTVSGSNIISVTDKSGKGVVLSNATGYRYPNNTFNGSYPSFLPSDVTTISGAHTLGVNTSFAVSTPFTVVFVAKRLLTSDNGGTFLIDSGGSSGANRPYIWDPAGSFTWYVATTTASTATSPTSSVIVTELGTSPTFFANGTNALSSPTSTNFTTGGITVGNRYTLDSGFPGHICELIIYSTSLSNTERQQIEGYLAWKWGLQASLPANHPYKNSSPNITNPAGISRPANVLPIPPITISARPRPVFLYTATFTYSAAGNQTFQVPSTIRPATVTVYMWGAGGGGNTNYGGAGAMVQGILPVTPGETLTIVVGQGGTIDGSTTYGGGGAGAGNMAGGSAPGIGYSGNGFPQNAGSGGGRSAIQRGGTDPTNDIVVAGGGGGGTYFSSDRGGAATFSGTANSGTGGLPGLGGTQTAGGAGGGTGLYGQGLGGSRGIGGNTYNTNIFNGGGGGGGGYYGGGGGGTNGGDGAGGGGGSSLTGGLSLISGQSVLGFNSTNGFTAPNTGSSYYQSGVGNGAPAINSSPRAGGNGLIVLTYFS